MIDNGITSDRSLLTAQALQDEETESTDSQAAHSPVVFRHI